MKPRLRAWPSFTILFYFFPGKRGKAGPHGENTGKIKGIQCKTQTKSRNVRCFGCARHDDQSWEKSEYSERKRRRFWSEMKFSSLDESEMCLSMYVSH